MSFLADLHIHSRYSLATSDECTLEGLQRWAQLKGVSVVGTGDCTHPGWLAELRAKLEPAAPGLYRLRAEFAAPVDADLPPACRAPLFFVLTTEISSIFRRDGKTRKVHSLILFPSIEAATAMIRRLEPHAKLASNGRPTTRLEPRELLSMALECDPESTLIPAHIWTPWFSLLGDKSGFDSLEECFGDLSGEVFALETGLSSDPPMNWRLSALDRLTLVSNSDLHSPAGLARDANLFLGEPDYYRMRCGLRSKDPAVCGGTIDLFPEAGKYHYDGHRRCGVALEPEETRKLDGLCPKCGKALTIGVLHRVAELADRPKGFRPPNALPHEYIIPLPELLAEIHGTAATAVKVRRHYLDLLTRFGPEMTILRAVPPTTLDQGGEARVAEAVRRVRRGEVTREPGFDGQYGRIRVF